MPKTPVSDNDRQLTRNILLTVAVLIAVFAVLGALHFAAFQGGGEIDPKPQPTPIVGEVFVTVVEESGDRPVRLARMLAAGVEDEVETIPDCRWVLLDQHDPKARPLKPFFETTSLPALLLISESGRVFDVAALPEDRDSLVARVRKLTKR